MEKNNFKVNDFYEVFKFPITLRASSDIFDLIIKFRLYEKAKSSI